MQGTSDAETEVQGLTKKKKKLQEGYLNGKWHSQENNFLLLGAAFVAERGC